MLSARRIMDGVVAGINAGGNQSGIPTPLGFLYFDDSFRGKPLVFAGTLGLIPKKIGERKFLAKTGQARRFHCYGWRARGSRRHPRRDFFLRRLGQRQPGHGRADWRPYYPKKIFRRHC